MIGESVMYLVDGFFPFANLDDCVAVDGLNGIAGLATVERCVERFQFVDLEHAPLKGLEENQYK